MHYRCRWAQEGCSIFILLQLLLLFSVFSKFCAFVQSILRVDSGDQTMGLLREPPWRSSMGVHCTLKERWNLGPKCKRDETKLFHYKSSRSSFCTQKPAKLNAMSWKSLLKLHHSRQTVGGRLIGFIIATFLSLLSRKKNLPQKFRQEIHGTHSFIDTQLFQKKSQNPTLLVNRMVSKLSFEI